MNELRERLKAIRAAIDQKRDERVEFVKARDEAKENFASSAVPVTELTQSDDFKAAEQAVKELGECDDAIADLQVAEIGILKMLGESTPNGAPRRAGPTDGQPAVSGWDVEGLLAGDAYHRFVESGMPSSKTKFGSVLFGQLADRETTARLLSAEVGSDQQQGAIAADRRGIIPPNLKRLSLLDLIPTGTTDSNVVEYVQVLTIPSSAAETGEGDVKPEESFTTQDADAPVRTVAGWLKVRKQALADVAGLRSLLGLLLPYDVRRRVESQLLIGDGQGQNLRGILETPNIGAPAAVPGDNPADAILRAVTVVVLSDADPNFVALHPLTWQDLLLMREDQANRTGAYIYGTPASPAAPTIWGLSITANRAVPEDAPLVGDAMGASLLVREGLNVLVSDSDQDDFIRNRSTILAETRVAFPVWKPTSFAVAPVGS
jgi:HK97 family phage major capsid protein